MTALCQNNGPSGPLPGFGASLAMSASAVAALLNNIPTPWAVAAAAYVGLTSYELATFCDQDPPPLPDITAADYFALITLLSPIAHVTAVKKFQDLIAVYLWYKVCHCLSGPTPAPPPAPAAPPGVPVLNPPPVAPVTPVPCAEFTVNYNPISGLQTNASALPVWTGKDVTLVHLDFQQTQPAAPFNTIHYELQWTLTPTQSYSTVLRTDTFDLAGTVTFPLDIEPPIGANGLVVRETGTTAGGAASTLALHWQYFCAYARPGVPTPPCPPDPQVLSLLDVILQMVKLIQRQKAPFAYVPGARHNGVTGSGQLNVQGLIGVSIILTTVPAYLGNIAGDPPELFDVGFVTVGTADGWHRSIRLDHNPTLVLPIEGSETLIGYTLEPNVVADILELVREP